MDAIQVGVGDHRVGTWVVQPTMVGFEHGLKEIWYSKLSKV
jgi:hypothetical protein